MLAGPILPFKTLISFGYLSKVRLAHPFQERNKGGESFIVLGVAQLLHQALGLLLGQLLSEIGEEPEEILAEDGLVLVLVVQLEDLNEVMDATGVLGVLGALEDGVHVLKGDHLLALLLHAADLVDGLVGGVQVAGPDEVANVETVDLAITLEVVHLKGELDLFNIPRVDAPLLSDFLIASHCKVLNRCPFALKNPAQLA